MADNREEIRQRIAQRKKALKQKRLEERREKFNNMISFRSKRSNNKEFFEEDSIVNGEIADSDNYSEEVYFKTDLNGDYHPDSLESKPSDEIEIQEDENLRKKIFEEEHSKREVFVEDISDGSEEKSEEIFQKNSKSEHDQYNAHIDSFIKKLDIEPAEEDSEDAFSEAAEEEIPYERELEEPEHEEPEEYGEDEDFSEVDEKETYPEEKSNEFEYEELEEYGEDEDFSEVDEKETYPEKKSNEFEYEELEEYGEDENYSEFDEEEEFEDTRLGRKQANKRKEGILISAVIFICIFISVSVLYYGIVKVLNEDDREQNSTELTELYNVSNGDLDRDGNYKNLAPFKEINHGTVGYVMIPSTKAGSPIVQAKDNSYYVNRDFYGEYSRYSAKYLDYRNKLGDKGPKDQNTIIYSENIHKDSLFSKMKKYNDIKFYKAHPIIHFNTLKTKTKWKVFASFITNTTENYGEIFEYNNPEIGESAVFFDFIDGVRKRSLINTPVDVKETDKLLTFSVASDIFPNARFVVMARLIREDKSSSVDVSKATANENPLYPDIWYSLVDKDAKKPIFE